MIWWVGKVVDVLCVSCDRFVLVEMNSSISVNGFVFSLC